MVASGSKLTPEELAYGRIVFWRGLLLVTLLCWGVVLYQVGSIGQQSGFLVTSLRWRLAGVIGLGIEGLILALLVVSFTPLYVHVYDLMRSGFGFLLRLRALNVLPVLACAGLFAFAIYDERGFLFPAVGTRIGLLWMLALPAGVFLRAAVLAGQQALPARPSQVPLQALRGQSWVVSFLAALIAIMGIYKVVGFAAEVSAYPLSLGWSEASRFYYASLFFSERLYGMDLPWPFLHPSRYMLQSLPYMIPELPLLAHRLWQVLLWVGMTGLVSVLLVRRLRPATAFQRWVLLGWAFLFLFQGPVYYHLLVCVAIILWGFQPRKLWVSLTAVVAASLWAGVSRINWFPVPAFLAVMIYLLEVPVSASRGLWDYIRRPMLWGVAGGLSAFAAQAGYILVSGNQDVKSFGSSFTSDLLWYRLWPSPTYPPGIFPMIMILSLPLLLVVTWFVLRRALHPLRLVGLAGMTLVMLAGGLVVSTKIGGGSNLHNLDAYLVLLMVWGSWLVFDRWLPETPAAQAAGVSARNRSEGVRQGKNKAHHGNEGAQQDINRAHRDAPLLVLLLVALMPIYALIREGGPIEARQTESIQRDSWEDVRTIQAHVDEVVSRGGEVLFISQRHLLTFGMIQGVELEPAYETVELMEMAMSGNEEYLNQFYSDLRTHRFDLIVTGELNLFYKGAQDSFPEENNVWVERISTPVLEYYQGRATMEHSRTQLLVPKP